MTSSIEATPRRVIRGDLAAGASALSTPELRAGAWTRLGDKTVLGDEVTEQVLAGIAESAANAARAQGYATGWSQGRREAAAQARVEAAEAEAVREAAAARRAAEHAAAVAALGRAADELQHTLAAVAAAVEDQALALARELTVRLVGHELRTTADPAGDVVRRALAVLPNGAPATVRLHPTVSTTDAVETLRAHGVTVVGDPAVAPHEAVVDTGAGVVDVSIAAALSRVEEVLA